MAWQGKIVLGGGLLAALAVAIAGYVAVASPPDAWGEFRQKVASKCIALALGGDYEKAIAEVDPFGTQTWGIALVRGSLKKGLGEASAICVMDKKTGAAELGGERKAWVTMDAAPGR
jgi:hypothetical protein